MSLNRCCYNLLNVLGFFSTETDPRASFSDRSANISHDKDEELFALHKKIHFGQRFKIYNPDPENESKVFNTLSGTKRGEMLQRNALLLSRVFIKNARTAKLDQLFEKHQTIRILDLGCGSTPTLIGILALFGAERVHYVGVDLDSELIRENQQAYAEFKQVEFQDRDAREFLQEEKQQQSFDLVLMQHPNIEMYKSIFTEIYQASDKVLKQGGCLYSTFYYDDEIQAFKDEIRPTMRLKQGWVFTETHNYHHSLRSVITNKLYEPENHLFLSKPKML